VISGFRRSWAASVGVGAECALSLGADTDLRSTGRVSSSNLSAEAEGPLGEARLGGSGTTDTKDCAEVDDTRFAAMDREPLPNMEGDSVSPKRLGVRCPKMLPVR
jgi:hypothetical protein